MATVEIDLCIDCGAEQMTVPLVGKIRCKQCGSVYYVATDHGRDETADAERRKEET